MAFLRTTTAHEAALPILGAGVVLRPPLMFDYPQWAELRALSREHLRPWEPTWPPDDLTRAAFRRRLRHYNREARDDLGYAFLIVAPGTDKLLGGLTLSNVRRGVTQAATLGYWLGAPHTGQGIMSRAVKAVMPYAFDVLRLHRLEAAIQPSNAASVRVLEKCGFVYEGLARRALKINGTWQDHLLFAVLADDTRQQGGPA